MEESLKVVYVEHPEEKAWEIIGTNLDLYNRQLAGDMNFQRLCFTLNTSDGQILGGVLGEVFWNWMHLDLLWIKEEIRGHGHGHRLLMAIEEEARKRGVTDVFLDTFSFQAPDFYHKHGYRQFGDLTGFPGEHHRFFFTKTL